MHTCTAQVAQLTFPGLLSRYGMVGNMLDTLD